MPDFNDGDVVRLGAAMVYNTSDAIVNVWHVKINSGGPMAFPAASQDFAEYIWALHNALVALYTNKLVSDRISVKNETQATVWGAIAWAATMTGSNPGDPHPLQTCLLGWARTSLSRVQMRKYFGPFTEVEMGSGLWLSAVRTACENVMIYHIAPQTMTNGLVLQGVAYNKALARATLGLTTATAEVPVVQRRRRVGRGA